MKFIWLLLMLVTGLALAGETEDDIAKNTPRKILVISPVASDIVLSDIEKRMINKIVLKACAKKKEYQIALGEIGIARGALLNIFEVSLEITGKENDFKLTGILLDEKNKVVLNKIVRTKNERLHLMRNIEMVMETLFEQVSKHQSTK